MKKLSIYDTEPFDFIYVIPCKYTGTPHEIRLIGERDLHGIQFSSILWNEREVVDIIEFLADQWDGSFTKHLEEVAEQHLEKPFIDVEESDYTMAQQDNY